ncbi:uncharacterized protein A1O9_07960 [Exophiala aquamarina CBS 119918]|uniref:Transcription factor domain-containing protein n=1 Tax=Exophiala aquamarina CBS 119918 TaxID=1182545 RepID=A0A072P8G2_9EURO|nr:uncharacterized protein A1O9_07960 [Exophiala aquamarina CBS 119918]KEF56379.1 hypothetical protein A1O9_07960 [Exophiala aquamarina CBS 119918]
MDLFDTGGYFSQKIPILAATRPLLKHAACAFATKHLQRVRRQADCSHNYSRSQTAIGEISQNFSHVDWSYKSVEHYDNAISLLLESVQLVDSQQEVYGEKGYPDEILATVAILSMYELMDAPGPEWKAHLSALPLLDNSSFELHNPTSSISNIQLTAAKRSIFWNFARQDFLSAFIGETRTRLDPGDVQLWRKVGIHVDENGILLQNKNLRDFRTNDAGRETLHSDDGVEVEEDMISNSMIWLLGKIVNFLAAGDGIYPGDFELPTARQQRFAIPQEELLGRWNLLQQELQTWYDSLPSTFAPCARTKLASQDTQDSPIDLPNFEKVWYSIPMCAATMQYYHMARIILLVNRPQESTAIKSSITARLWSYRMIQEEAQYHSREICGISLSNLPDAVRIHSLQPLFVAGQCLSETFERRAVLGILSSIQKDLGWATGYRMRKLEEEWNAG